MAVLLLPAAAAAGSLWQWQMSLEVEKVGDAMYMPSAVAFDKEAERYYVVDTGQSRLVSFGRDGKLVKAFTANGQLKSPFDMVRLDNGQLWVVEKGRNSLTHIDIPGKTVTTNTLHDGERLVFPDRLAVSKGKLHVLDRSSGQVLRLNADLSVEQRFGCQDCSAGLFDFVLVDDSVVALEPRDKRIYQFRPDGTVDREINLGDEVGFPVSLAVGPSGFFYVLDRHVNNIVAYDQGGKFRYRFLSSGSIPGKIFYARELRFDPWGQLCVVDEGNGRVEVYSH